MASPLPLVLIVDDEPDLVAPLAYALQREGFATRTAATAEAALVEAARDPIPDLVLLDRMLPDLPGTEVFRRLRGQPRTAAIPVIMVSAKGDEVDRIVGLELGVDDYVTKPFSTRELILRVRAVLRRVSASEGPAPPEARIEVGVLAVEPEAHQVWVEGREIHLTALEFRLLMALVGRRGRVRSREALLAEAWEDGITVTARTVDTHVKRLRRKLGPAARYVETIRGVGYRFASRPEGG